MAVHEGGETEIAIAGHGDEIGFMVRDVTEDGYLRLSRIGGSDRTVTRGQHVTVHTDEGPVAGVVGQTAIHGAIERTRASKTWPNSTLTSA